MSKTPKPGSDDAATGRTSSGNTGIECAPKFDCQRPTVAVIAFILKKPPFIETGHGGQDSDRAQPAR